MNEREGFGLVFSGGGGKGAYEIGVWKALLQTKKIKIGAVSGTSVGALNAALYAAGDYKMAEEIWKNITPDKILSPKMFRFEKYLQQYITEFTKAYNNTELLKLMGASIPLQIYLKSRGGMFSREGLVEIIERSGIPETMPDVTIPCYATCFNMSALCTEYFQLNQMSKEMIISVLLASSAIPFVFPRERVGDQEYHDGGLPLIGDNVPVKPLYDAGWRKFLVVHLNREGIEEFSSKYKKCRFIHVFPKNNQGGLLDGTLDFSPESASERIQQGYKDMMHQIKVINGVDTLLDEKKKITEEICFNSGKYSRSMDEILDACEGELGKRNPGKPEITDKDTVPESVKPDLDKICKELESNNVMMNKFILLGISNVFSSDAELDERQRSGNFFKRLLNTVTGKNEKLQYGIDRGLINGQRACMYMIEQLVESDKINTELIRAMQVQWQSSALRMARILKRQGEELGDIHKDIDKLTDRYFELYLSDQKMAGEIKHIYEIISSNNQRVEDRFRKLEDRIDDLEYAGKLRDWLLKIKFQETGNVEYRNLDVAEKVICVAADFFLLTGGEWDDELLLYVKSALDQLGVEPYELILYADLIIILSQNDVLERHLLERNGIDVSFYEENGYVTPLHELIIKGIYYMRRLEEIQIDRDRSELIYSCLESNGMDACLRITAFDAVCILLMCMKSYHEDISDDPRLEICSDLRKRALLGDVSSKQRYVEFLYKHKYIDGACKEMRLLEEYMDGDDFINWKAEIFN